MRARRAVRYGNGWIPIAGRPIYGNFDDFLPQFKQMLAEAGRSLADAPITMFGATADYDQLMRYRELGVAGSSPACRRRGADKMLPVLDRWAELIRKTAH